MTTRSDHSLALALARGLSHRQAAADARVSLSTVTRRLRDADFRAAVEDARRGLVEEMIARLSGAARDAAETLNSLAMSAESENVRFQAAARIADLLLKHRADTEVEARLAELEAMAKEMEART